MVKIHHLGPTRSLRVVWQCEEMALPYELEPASFPTSPAYRALNPIGSLPFLEDDGGVAINESVAMMLYLATRYGPTPLLPGPGDPALARVMQFVIFGEATLGAWGNVMMVTTMMAPADQKDTFQARFARDRMNSAQLDIPAPLLAYHDRLQERPAYQRAAAA